MVKAFNINLKDIVVVVYHVTIVAMDMSCWRNFGLLVLGCVLRTAGNSIIWNYADPFTSLELLNYYLTVKDTDPDSAKKSVQIQEKKTYPRVRILILKDVLHFSHRVFQVFLGVYVTTKIKWFLHPFGGFLCDIFCLDFIEAFKCQEIVVSSFSKLLSASKDENWLLPVMQANYCVSRK